MRRSICYCEPNLAFVGQVANWKFFYTTAVTLPKGTILKFNLFSQGRISDWQIPETSPQEKNNRIWLQIPESKSINAKKIDQSTFEFSLSSELKAGETAIITIGASEEGSKEGNRAQTFLQRKRAFHLYIDPKGKGDWKEPEIFTLDVKGSSLENIRIIAPSLVSKNKRFDVIIRFEDCYGNLTHQAPEGTLIELSYKNLRENLNWKLFVPETGFINIPNLYFGESGIYRIKLRNLTTKEVFYSPPIKCSTDLDADKSIFWGQLHGESERFDTGDDIETCLRYLRDEKNFHFFASSSFENTEETSNDTWKVISSQIAEFNEDLRFSTFLGFQWAGKPLEEGIHQLIYSKDNKPILRKKDVKNSSLKKIYRAHSPKEFLSIASFSMAKGMETNFKEFDPDFERVVEIYNCWGSSECLEKEGNLRPIAAKNGKEIVESEKGSIRQALNRNCRFGFVAGGLDDRGIYNGLYEGPQVQYSAGLTAIIASEQTRESLFQALYQRSCYATTGDRIVLGFFIAGACMGSELNTKIKPGLIFNRHITGFIATTENIKEVAIIRNGVVFKTINPNQTEYEFAIDDTDLISKISLQSPDDRPPFIYYYLKITQENGHIAWSSPIWVDHTELFIHKTPSKKLKKKEETE